MMQLRKWLMLVVCVSAMLAVSCSGSAPAATNPVVQIIAPPYGSSFSENEIVGVQAVSTDAQGVVRAELYVDGQLAGTKLAPSAQGTRQFESIFEWQATKLGAHTLTVRAFNAANGMGEASLPVAVNPPAAAPTAPQIENTPTPQVVIVTATPPAVPPTPIPATNIPPTNIPPTAVPPTDVPPTNIPPTNVPPLVFLPPFDGGMNVSVNWSENGLFIESQANDTLAGNDNGDGIAYIEFFVQDLQGNILASHRENNKPYCYFGDANGECITPVQGDANFKWSDTQPIKEGWYFIRAVAYTPDKRMQVAERSLRINFPPDSFEDLFVNLDQPNNFNLERELVFEASVSGSAADAGIDRVEMFVVQYDGKIVQARTERSPRYCGFSGGDNNAPCPPYRFDEHALKWPDGTPVYPTQYVVRAIVYTKDGQLSAASNMFQVDKVK